MWEPIILGLAGSAGCALRGLLGARNSRKRFKWKKFLWGILPATLVAFGTSMGLGLALTPENIALVVLSAAGLSSLQGKIKKK